MSNIYTDIARRTGGNIYIGVVGPVRTGESTFIKEFMEEAVIPNIESDDMKERAIDELPQSAGGRTIMTTEPKFIPEEAVSLTLDENTEVSVRLVDCVGYMVEGATGQFEDGTERLVTTPWFDHEISMTDAAEQGTIFEELLGIDYETETYDDDAAFDDEYDNYLEFEWECRTGR